MIAKTRHKQDARDERQAAPPGAPRAGRFGQIPESLYPLVQPITRPLLLLAQAENPSLRRRHAIALYRQTVLNAVETLRIKMSLSETQACRLLSVNNVSFSRWRAAKARSGFAGLIPAVSPGRPPHKKAPAQVRKPERDFLNVRRQGKKLLLELNVSTHAPRK
jgi:hypothetical protein